MSWIALQKAIDVSRNANRTPLTSLRYSELPLKYPQQILKQPKFSKIALNPSKNPCETSWDPNKHPRNPLKPYCNFLGISLNLLENLRSYLTPREFHLKVPLFPKPLRTNRCFVETPDKFHGSSKNKSWNPLKTPWNSSKILPKILYCCPL